MAEDQYELHKAATEDERRARRPKKWDKLSAPLFGAALALIVGTIVNYGSNFLARRDENLREAEACKRTVSLYLAILAVTRPPLSGALQSLETPLPPLKTNHLFSFPPFDEILHSQDNSLNFLDDQSQWRLIDIEAYYRFIRDELSNSPEVHHTGDAFGVPDSDAALYKATMMTVENLVDAETANLSRTHDCDKFSHTSII